MLLTSIFGTLLNYFSHFFTANWGPVISYQKEEMGHTFKSGCTFPPLPLHTHLLARCQLWRISKNIILSLSPRMTVWIESFFLTAECDVINNTVLSHWALKIVIAATLTGVGSHYTTSCHFTLKKCTCWSFSEGISRPLFSYLSQWFSNWGGKEFRMELQILWPPLLTGQWRPHPSSHPFIISL